MRDRARRVGGTTTRNLAPKVCVFFKPLLSAERCSWGCPLGQSSVACCLLCWHSVPPKADTSLLSSPAVHHQPSARSPIRYAPDFLCYSCCKSPVAAADPGKRRRPCWATTAKLASRSAGATAAEMPLEVRCPPDGRGTPSPESSPPFWKNLVAGGGAGLVEIACMYPTDVRYDG